MSDHLFQTLLLPESVDLLPEIDLSLEIQASKRVVGCEFQFGLLYFLH